MQIETCKHCAEEIERPDGLALLMGGWEVTLADEPENCEDAPRVRCDSCDGDGELLPDYADDEPTECGECDSTGDVPGKHEPAL